MYTYLTIEGQAPNAGVILLNPGVDNLIGRGLECHVVLADPHCSRVHAVLSQREGEWTLRDQSTNGTLVNDETIEGFAALADGCLLQMGESLLRFHHSEQSPTLIEPLKGNLGQTLVRDSRVESHDSGEINAALQNSTEGQDLLLLHQLAVRLLEGGEQSDWMAGALELLLVRCGAARAAFLHAVPDGTLALRLALPRHAGGEIALGESVTQFVIGEHRAVWLADQGDGSSANAGSKAGDRDVLCIPLVAGGDCLGAVYVCSTTEGRFRQSHFDFAISLANILAKAIVAGRTRAALEADAGRIGNPPTILESSSQMEIPSDATWALIRGEPGTGRETLAREMHRGSDRAGAFLALPAAHFNETLRGDHPLDDLSHAEAGTLFIREISHLEPPAQQRLLALLTGEEGLGLDAALIASTSRDLARLSRDGKFLPPLFERLSRRQIQLPPLRERGPDGLASLIDHFFHYFRCYHGRSELSLAEEARQQLLAYSWPGNIRQLRNVIDGGVAAAVGDEVQLGDLGPESSGEWESLKVSYWERKLIHEALRSSGGNVPAAAKLLGLGRATLYRKIDEFGIQR